MRVTPLFFAITYVIMGVGFMYLAFISAGETIWTVPTIIFVSIAALNFGVAIKMYQLDRRIKKNASKPK